jgi:hypothetical protein
MVWRSDHFYWMRGKEITVCLKQQGTLPTYEDSGCKYVKPLLAMAITG